MTYFDRYLSEKFANVVRDIDDLHDYQAELAVPFLIENPFSALFVDLGLGKTTIVLTLLAHLADTLDYNRILVLGPTRVVKQTWPTEIGLWRHTAPLTATVIRDDEFQEAVRKAGAIARKPIAEEGRAEALLRGYHPILDQKHTLAVINELVKLEHNANAIKKARILAARKAIREATARNPASIHLVNIEQTEMLVAAWGKDWPYDVVIIDESSALKDHSTKRFKALKRVRPLMRRMHQLTATPASEGYMGLFAQMYLLDEGKRLGRNITAYRSRYFSENYNGWGWTLRPDAEKEIGAKIADICLSLKKEDWLSMQEPVFRMRAVEMTEEETAIYKQFEKNYVVEMPDGEEIEAENAAALAGKLLQLASGCIYGRDKTTHAFHDHKIEELRQIVDEACGAPIIVAYWFKSSLERLKKAFPEAVEMDKDGKAVKPWNEKKIPILLLHPRSAGHGLNLQHGGHHLVFFDIPWSLELYLQTIGRIDRQGQLYPVILHHIYTKGTIEEYVIQVLREKGDMQEALFQILKLLRSRG